MQISQSLFKACSNSSYTTGTDGSSEAVNKLRIVTVALFLFICLSKQKQSYIYLGDQMDECSVTCRGGNSHQKPHAENHLRW